MPGLPLMEMSGKPFVISKNLEMSGKLHWKSGAVLINLEKSGFENKYNNVSQWDSSNFSCHMTLLSSGQSFSKSYNTTYPQSEEALIII